MKKLFFVLLVGVLASTIILSACAEPAPAPAPTPAPAPAPTPAPAPVEETWTLKFSFEQSETQLLTTEGHDIWAADVEQATDGRVKIQMFPNQTLMKTQEAPQGVKGGVSDVALTYSWLFPGVYDYLDCIMLPFAAPNAEISSKVSWDLFEKFPEAQAQYKDLKVLSMYTVGNQYPLTIDKQIKTLEDFAGLKLRTASATVVESLKLLGATPVTMPTTEVYMALQKGTVDGATYVPEAIGGFRLYEVTNYIALIPFGTVTQTYLMNKEVWEEFPPDIQEAIMSVSGKYLAGRMGRDVFDKAEEVLPGIIKDAGYELEFYAPPQAEIDRIFDVAGKPLWNDWTDEMVAKGRTAAPQVIAEMEQLVAEYSK